ncbi:MAG: hypothetical protein AAF636_10430 [Pseudomonadota bacterium]
MTALTALPAQARLDEVVCDDRERLHQQISGIREVQKVGQGMRGPHALLEIWVEPDSGDWTMVQTYANGTSCVLAMGEHWQLLETSATNEEPALVQ